MQPLHILFERGERELEPPVRAALTEIGANVTVPQEKGREDARLEDPEGRRYIVEIKGHKGALQIADVRQVHDWCELARDEEDWEGKPLIVCNLFCETPLDSRSNLFPGPVVKAAKRNKIALLTTGQLFQALCEAQAGTLDQTAFWAKVYAAAGAVDVPTYAP
jgi:hypothetical protein